MDWTTIVSSFIAGILLSMASTSFSVVFFIIWQQSSSPEMQYAYMVGLMVGETVRNIALHDTYKIEKKLEKIEEELEKICEKLENINRKIMEILVDKYG